MSSILKEIPQAGDSIGLSPFGKFKLSIVRLLHWEYFGICLLAAVILALHFSTIMQPRSLLFDESYYVPDARSIMAQQGTITPEQTPLAKLFIMFGITVFEDNPLGWRFFAVVFGTVCIIFLYFICRRLQMSNGASLTAAFLFTFENLNFVQSSIAMLDVFSMGFMFAAIYFFLREKLVAAGLLAGLSALAKLPGILVLAIFFLYWLFTNRRRWQIFVIPVLTAAVSFIVLLPVLDYTVTTHISNPVERIRYVLSYGAALNFDMFASSVSGIISRPWDWLMNKGTIFYSYEPQYIGMVSITVSALIIPVICYTAYKFTHGSRAALLSLSWIVCLYLPWVFASLAFGRLTYIYYMYPVTGGICIGLGLLLSEIWQSSRNARSKARFIGLTAVPVYLILHLAVFVILSHFIPALGRWM